MKKEKTPKPNREELTGISVRISTSHLLDRLAAEHGRRKADMAQIVVEAFAKQTDASGK